MPECNKKFTKEYVVVSTYKRRDGIDYPVTIHCRSYESAKERASEHEEKHGKKATIYEREVSNWYAVS